MARNLRIVNEKGLHARASAKFVETVEAFDASAEVTKDGMSVSGDSIMSVSPEYESVLRKGVKVHTNTVWRLVGDKLVGHTVAHYAGAGADSVLQLRSEGTKAPK